MDPHVKARPCKRTVGPTPASDAKSEPRSKKRASDPARAAETSDLATLIQSIRCEFVDKGSISLEKVSQLLVQLSPTTDYMSMPVETIKAIIDVLRLLNSDEVSEPPSDPPAGSQGGKKPSSNIEKVKAIIDGVRASDLEGGTFTPFHVEKLQKALENASSFDDVLHEDIKILGALLSFLDQKTKRFLDMMNLSSLRPLVPPTAGNVEEIDLFRRCLHEAHKFVSETGSCGPYLEDLLLIMRKVEDQKIHISPNELTGDYEAKITSLISFFSAHSGSAPSPLLCHRLRFYGYENPDLVDVLVSMMTPNA